MEFNVKYAHVVRHCSIPMSMSLCDFQGKHNGRLLLLLDIIEHSIAKIKFLFSNSDELHSNGCSQIFFDYHDFFDFNNNNILVRPKLNRKNRPKADFFFFVHMWKAPSHSEITKSSDVHPVHSPSTPPRRGEIYPLIVFLI